MPFAANFEEISFLIRNGAIFSEVKRSNMIETIQYFKKIIFLTSLRISRPNQNHMKHSDLGKSLASVQSGSGCGMDCLSQYKHLPGHSPQAKLGSTPCRASPQ
jgi:hypothetical protein